MQISDVSLHLHALQAVTTSYLQNESQHRFVLLALCKLGNAVEDICNKPVLRTKRLSQTFACEGARILSMGWLLGPTEGFQSEC